MRAPVATTSRGYAQPGYAASLAEFGKPRLLPRSGGWVLERAVPRAGARDAMGPYPLFGCADWAGVAPDLEELEGTLVSLVLVVDPLSGAGERELRRAFPDRLTVLKRHAVRDLDRPARLPEHHRRHVRRAAAAVRVEVCAEPADHLDEWVGLYAGLAARHGLVGIRAFSRASFRRQLALPGLLALRARRDEATVGMTLWLEDAPHAHYHLGAYSSAGYEVGASYALFAAALEELAARGVRRVDLGGAAGAGNADGLLRFKRGWANAERDAHLGARILDRVAYARLSGRPAETGWFPAYRAAEADLGALPA